MTGAAEIDRINRVQIFRIQDHRVSLISKSGFQGCNMVRSWSVTGFASYSRGGLLRLELVADGRRSVVAVEAPAHFSAREALPDGFVERIGHSVWQVDREIPSSRLGVVRQRGHENRATAIE